MISFGSLPFSVHIYFYFFFPTLVYVYLALDGVGSAV